MELLNTIQNIMFQTGTVFFAIGFAYMIIVWISLDPAGFFIGIWVLLPALISFFKAMFSNWEKFEPACMVAGIGTLLMVFGSPT
jgi:hypothetical protein